MGVSVSLILIAVGAHLDDAQQVAALLALLPELVARATPEMCELRLQGKGERLRVHPGEHQHLARGGIGDDGRDQPVGIELGLEGRAGFDLGRRAARGEL